MQNDLLFSSIYARLLLRADIAGIDNVSETLLDGVGFTEADLLETPYIRWSQVRHMLENIATAGAAPDWPAKFAEQLNVGSHGSMGFATLSAPTLGDALNVLTEYHATRTATLEARVEQDKQYCHFIIDELTHDPRHGRQLLEMSIKVLLSLIEAIVGHDLRHHVSVHFDYAKQKDGKDLEKILGVKCFYKQSQSEIMLPVSWINIVSPLYDEEVYRANLVKCRDQMAALFAIQKDPQSLVKHRIAQHFDNAIANNNSTAKLPDLERCANELNMSTRTLLRRLQSQDTSYKKILESVRKEYAAQLLQTTHLTIANIAYRLAYTDPSNFVRAFRQWYDCSPAAWRQQA